MYLNAENHSWLLFISVTKMIEFIINFFNCNFYEKTRCIKDKVVEN